MMILRSVQTAFVRPKLAPGEQEALKWLAFTSMIIDHTGKALGDSLVFHYLGRLALPIFCFLVAYNLAVRCVPARRYVTPLLLTGLLSQIPYTVLWGTAGMGQLNILFTLLVGVCAVWLIPKTGYVVAGVLAAIAGLVCEYAIFGPLLLVAWYGYLKRPSVLRFSIVVVLAYLCNTGLAALIAAASCLIPLVLRVKVKRTPKYLFYTAYPLHLSLLAMLVMVELAF